MVSALASSYHRLHVDDVCGGDGAGIDQRGRPMQGLKTEMATLQFILIVLPVFKPSTTAASFYIDYNADVGSQARPAAAPSGYPAAG